MIICSWEVKNTYGTWLRRNRVLPEGDTYKVSDPHSPMLLKIRIAETKLLTSRFARKQKKYSRITIVLLSPGHFWLHSTHEIVTMPLY